MKALTYALILLAVLVGSILLLRSLDPPPPSLSPSPDLMQDERVAESLPLTTNDAPAGIDTTSTERLLAMGEGLMRTWHMREAADVFERLVAVDSTDYAGWARLVECYSHPLVCREDAARTAWKNASLGATAPGDTIFLAGLKRLFIDEDYAAAVGDFKAARQYRDDARDYLALAYYLSGRLTEAETELQTLLKEDFRDGRQVELSVRLMVARDDLGRAASRGRELARDYAQEPFPYVLLAQIELQRGDHGAAEEFCNNALLLDPRYIPAVMTRANLYVAVGEYESARVSFEKLMLFDDAILRGIAQEGIAFVDFLTGRFGSGISAMDEAIRHSIMAGSVRRSLLYASRLVAYLCELGRADDADAVINRWVKGSGEVPERLVRVRLNILRAQLSQARAALSEIRSDKEVLVWARVLSIDGAELGALAFISEGELEKALDRLDAGIGVHAGIRSRRSFVHGYASFENGDAENARLDFESARAHLFGVEFPYRGDPVLAVQSLFFIAESAIAAGDETRARENYSAFLGYWGDSLWELAAVKRAQAKLTSLEKTGLPQDDSPPSDQ